MQAVEVKGRAGIRPARERRGVRGQEKAQTVCNPYGDTSQSSAPPRGWNPAHFSARREAQWGASDLAPPLFFSPKALFAITRDGLKTDFEGAGDVVGVPGFAEGGAWLGDVAEHLLAVCRAPRCPFWEAAAQTVGTGLYTAPGRLGRGLGAPLPLLSAWLTEEPCAEAGSHLPRSPDPHRDACSWTQAPVSGARPARAASGKACCPLVRPRVTARRRGPVRLSTPPPAASPEATVRHPPGVSVRAPVCHLLWSGTSRCDTSPVPP